MWAESGSDSEVSLSQLDLPASALVFIIDWRAGVPTFVCSLGILQFPSWGEFGGQGVYFSLLNN